MRNMRRDTQPPHGPGSIASSALRVMHGGGQCRCEFRSLAQLAATNRSFSSWPAVVFGGPSVESSMRCNFVIPVVPKAYRTFTRPKDTVRQRSHGAPPVANPRQMGR